MTARTNSSIFKDKYFDGLENGKKVQTLKDPKTAGFDSVSSAMG